MANPKLTTHVQVHAHVPLETKAELERIAMANHRSIAGELRAAVQEHLQREQPADQEGE